MIKFTIDELNVLDKIVDSTMNETLLNFTAIMERMGKVKSTKIKKVIEKIANDFLNETEDYRSLSWKISKMRMTLYDR